jgi:hypothetical protein
MLWIKEWYMMMEYYHRPRAASFRIKGERMA